MTNVQQVYPIISTDQSIKQIQSHTIEEKYACNIYQNFLSTKLFGYFSFSLREYLKQFS